MAHENKEAIMSLYSDVLDVDAVSGDVLVIDIAVAVGCPSALSCVRLDLPAALLVFLLRLVSLPGRSSLCPLVSRCC